MVFRALLQRLAHLSEQNGHLCCKEGPCVCGIQLRFNMGFQTPVGKSRSCAERLELNTKNKPFTPLVYSSPRYYPWLHSLAINLITRREDRVGD